MAAKKLKGNASKVAAFALASVLAGTGIAVSMQNLGSISASAATAKYTSDYSSKQEAINAGYALNIKVAEEGMVLLKNENDTLPLLTKKGLHAKGVTVFGIAGLKPQGGSGANGGDTSSGQVGDAGTVYDTLTAAGYRVNPYVRDFYQTNGITVDNRGRESNKTDYQLKEAFDAQKAKLSASYDTYGDAAVIVLNVGDATNDKYDKETNPNGISYNTQYNEAQYELVEHAKQYFDKVIVFINKAYPVEIDRLKKDPGVDAILLVNEPGTNGLVAAGSIMNGTVNPSGRLADTFSVDQTKDPAYVNFPNKTLGRFKDADGKNIGGGFTDYEEGIYVGYRYWETRAVDELKLNPSSTWYEDNVSYTFGYGLSYTTFDWEVTPHKAANSKITDATGVLKFDVKVTNTGKYAGKDVVQLYLHNPYYEGGIEKAENVLEDFAKTDILAPGESQTVTLSVKVRDLASYDWSDANHNGNQGYELENGTIGMRIMHSAHYDTEKDTEISYIVEGTDGNNNAAKCIYVKEAETGYTIENQFEYMNAYASGYSDTLTDKDGNKYSTYEFKNITDGQIGFDAAMSRATGYTKTVGEGADAVTLKGLQVPATAPVDIVTTTEKITEFAGQTIDDSEDQPWYVAPENMPKYMTDEDREAKPKADIVLSQLTGKAYDDPQWEKLLDQLTLREMQDLINYGGWNTGAIPYIGKPSTRDTDGPKGWSGSNRGGETGNMICAEPMIAATFNTDLIYEVGKNMGDQGLWGSTDRTDGGAQESYTCWYAPGMNLHRGPFDGRLAEYYSEDPVLMGKMAAAISLGMRAKGGYVTMKHFALHQDGSTVRTSGGNIGGLWAWANEQTLRELYLRSYQICASEGEANDAMASFTRFGYLWAGASYSLNTVIFRYEWGCNGYNVTDIVLNAFQDMNQMIRAGGNLRLIRSGATGAVKLVDEKTGEVDQSQLTATQVTAMRNACKGILWSVANSNAMQVPPGAEVRYTTNNKVIAATVGTELEVTMPTATLGTTRYAYSTITYAVTDGNLPTGLTLNRNTGALTGTPTVTGNYNIEITASADGYTPASIVYTIVVAGTQTSGGTITVDNTAVLEAIEALGVKIDGIGGGSDGSVDLSSVLEAIEALGTKIDAIGGGSDGNVDLSSVTTQLTNIKTVLDAVKAAVDGIDIPETDLSAVNAKIADLETKVTALEAAANETPNEEGGCNGSIVSTGIAFAVATLGIASYVAVKRFKKNEQ